MNEDIERLNEENRRQNEAVSPGDQSKAAFSSITTNEQDNKRSLAEGIIQDLANQRTDIDAIKQALGVLLPRVEQIVQALNNLAPGATPQTPEQGKINMETLSALGDLGEKVITAYKNLKGTPAITDSFTQQITENAKAEAIESLNIVHLINKKVKGKLVADIAGDIAGNVINDSNKLNTHEPQ